jgi:hypothetical protein
MLGPFDWVRRSRSGAELLATLNYLEAHPGLSRDRPAQPGPPFSALNGPCLRCWVYPRAPNSLHCAICKTIVREALPLHETARAAIVIWGFVNRLPRSVTRAEGGSDSYVLGAYVHDERRFLAMLYYRDLQPWLQELAIYHGTDLKGLLQICHATESKDMSMGEVLNRMIQDEARFPSDRLRVRFFAQPHQVFAPRLYEREGVLTFEADEFLRMLDMAVVFRSMLPPDEQKILHKLLLLGDTSEAQFYWGRLLGILKPEAKDMLNAWKIRQWSRPQVNLLYELAEYVGFYHLG